MGLVSSIRTILGFEEEMQESSQRVYTPVQTARKSVTRPEPQNIIAADFQTKKASRKAIDPASSADIVIIAPRQEEDSRLICTYLKQGYSVIVHATKYLDTPTARRLIDFVYGTIFAFEGRMQKLSSGSFLCTPGSVEIIDTQQDDVLFNDTQAQATPEQPYYTEQAPTLDDEPQYQRQFG